jgi:hypothetical protein
MIAGLWTALAARAAAPPTSLGPIVVRGQDAELQLRFAGQLQAQADLPDPEGPHPALSVRIRRLRFGLGGRALDGRVSAGLQLNLAPGAAEMLDAWGEIAAAEGLAVRLGQYKIPFTRYREQSFTAQLLADWPVAAKAFGSERQLGVSAGDGPPGRDAFGWSLGLFTGANARKAFATGVADAHGVTLDNPSDLASGSTTLAPHPELVGRITAGTPGSGIDASTGFDFDGGPARALVGLSGAWDLAPDPTIEFGARGAAEALLKVEHVSVGAVGYLGLHETRDGALAAGAVGATGELAWRADPRLGVALSWSRVDVLPSLRSAAQAWADAQLAAADPEDSDTLAETLAAAGAMVSVSELGAGVTWFAHGTGLCVQLDGAWLRSAARGTATDAARIRLQGQIVF